jgi:hypothetical protein
MKRSRWLILGAAGIAGAVAVRAAAGRAVPAAASPYHSLTVFRPIEYVRANMPPPLAGLGPGAEVQLRPAPGDRGTEIHVRQVDDRVSADEIRRALRAGRSQLEVGDVLEPGVATTTPTLLNKGLRAVTGRGREKGLL